MSRSLKTLMVLALALSACDAFVCSKERMQAMELANRGVASFQNGLYDAAERDLKLAIQTDPSFDLAHYNLGKVMEKQHKWDKAIEAFEGAATRSPNNANYQYDLGAAYLETAQLDQAEKALKRATELDPKLYLAHYRLGVVYKRLERPKDADAALRAAIEANARFDKPFVELGHMYLDFDASDAAEKVFGECVKANDGSAECYNGHGLALKEQKKYEAATSEFKKALQLQPSLSNAIYNEGMTYAEWFEESHQNEHRDRAREYLQKFVTSGSKDGGFGYVKAATDKLYALSGS